MFTFERILSIIIYYVLLYTRIALMNNFTRGRFLLLLHIFLETYFVGSVTQSGLWSLVRVSADAVGLMRSSPSFLRLGRAGHSTLRPSIQPWAEQLVVDH